MLNSLSKLRIDGNFLKLIANIYKKLNIILNGERMNAFPLR